MPPPPTKTYLSHTYDSYYPYSLSILGNFEAKGKKLCVGWRWNQNSARNLSQSYSLIQYLRDDTKIYLAFSHSSPLSATNWFGYQKKYECTSCILSGFIPERSSDLTNNFLYQRSARLRLIKGHSHKRIYICICIFVQLFPMCYTNIWGAW